MSSKDKKERRREKRIPFREDILVNGTTICKGIDISEGGLYIYTDRLFAKNSTIQVTLPFKDKKIIIKAIVQHNQPGIGIGVKFFDLNDMQKAIIQELNKVLLDESAKLIGIHERKKILLIEDNDIARQINKNRLSLEGFFVIEARDGIEAMNLLKKQTPDLIIFDLDMKTMDGFKLLSIFKISPQWKNIPVIVFSSRGTKDVIEKVIQAGADEFLSKMVTSPSKLSETAKAILQRYHKA